MDEDRANALVRVDSQPSDIVAPRHPLGRFASTALAVVGRNSVARKAALVGAAFGLGYQVSKWARSGTLPQIAEDVKDLYQVANGGDASAEGRIAGGWVRESFTVISAVYRFLDSDDGRSKR